MPDIIQLLSDHLANQIAAGEVIQRPASAVKELLENAIDAGATEIELYLKDAGKELIQVIDNGKGMSPTDARMSFERHATSKIKNIEDLFHIRTMGFRGEALASIAAVAQVELKTRLELQEVGTKIIIEGTEIKSQEPCSTPVGTQFQIKNLFYNIPARRNFLKSNNTEYKHILDEFTRVAMAYPTIGFKLFNNNTEQFHLTNGTLKNRIIGLLGASAEKNLVPVIQETEWITINGFIGKPEAATKSRGNQFFFINNRFIRNAYLNHAVSSAYEGMIGKDSFPFYVLFINIDPSKVDVNVHPTKQEVKFDDDKLIYAFLQAAIKHNLARFNIAPSLDFSLNPTIQHLSSVQLPATENQKSATEKGYLYNNYSGAFQAHKIAPKGDFENWKSMYSKLQTETLESMPIEPIERISKHDTANQTGTKMVLRLQGQVLVSTIKSGLVFIHQRRALERIAYEKLQQKMNEGAYPSQQLLFPIIIDLSATHSALLLEVLPLLISFGILIEPFGSNTFSIQGLPLDMVTDEQKMIQEIIEQIQNCSSKPMVQLQEQLCTYIAKQMSYKTLPQNNEVLQTLIDELFACAQPEYTSTGKKIFVIQKMETIEKLLG